MFKAPIYQHLFLYPSPRGINNNWNYGAVLGVLFTLQIVTGLFLALFYKPECNLAFESVFNIIYNVDHGWLLKYLHLNGATFIFFFLYAHILKAIYYRSFLTLINTWLTGCAIFFLSIITAFLGYVLPWGQMSYWAATVITSLVTSIPVVGQKAVLLLWGDLTVGDASLGRFFVLHFLLALVIFALIFVHISTLHNSGSSSPINAVGGFEKVHFYYFFFYKDLFFIIAVLFALMFVVCFHPNAFNHPDNFVEANPLVTPTHIVPEWYFLPFYAILRSIPNKLLGVVAMLMSIIVLFALPFVHAFRKAVARGSVSAQFHEVWFYVFIYTSVMLGYLGKNEAIEPFITMSRFFSFLYFYLFLSIFFSWTDAELSGGVADRAGKKKTINGTVSVSKLYFVGGRV